MQMQQTLKKETPQTEDPFTILRNHRTRLIRPKAKYVRKVPLPVRARKTRPVKESIQICEYKNERKMTADCEIEIPSEEQPEESLILKPLEIVKNQQQEDRFFSEMIELDYVLPIQGRPNRNDHFLMSDLDNHRFIDFFSEE